MKSKKPKKPYRKFFCKPTLSDCVLEAVECFRHPNESPDDAVYRLLHEKQELEKRLLQVVMLPEFRFHVLVPPPLPPLPKIGNRKS